MSAVLSHQLKRLCHYIPMLISLGLFGLAIRVIAHEFHKYSFSDIVGRITAIHPLNLLLAVAITILNYGVLTGYDTLATRFVRHPLPYPKTALVGIISYAISNNVGLALLSSSAIRYRFYAPWGLTALKIAQIITFCNLSFWVGLFMVGGLVFATAPLSIPSLLHLPFATAQPLSLIFLAVIAAYLLLSSLSRRTMMIKGWVLPHLPLPLSLAQIMVASCDWALAAAVLYVLLPSLPEMNYVLLLGSYLLAQLAGVTSNVPGGLGVFETVLLSLLSPAIASDQLLGVLLVYRSIYYFLPLGTGVGLLLLYELKQRRDKAKFP